MTETSEDNRLIQQVTAQFDAPAFIRRARGVEDAWSRLVARCDQKRNELLKMPKLRLGVLAALAGEWSALEGLLVDPTDALRLKDLFEEWQPKLRVKVERTTSSRKLRQALLQLVVSFERFNQKWHEFTAELDLRELNKLRADYNRYYVLEKECSVRSATIARQGFRPLPPATIDDILRAFPLLQVPG